MLAFGSVRSVGSAWSDANAPIGARSSETSIVKAEMAQRARLFMEITCRLYFRRGRIDVIEIISWRDSDDDALPIDAVQCRLVDRARQTQLHPRGQLHLDRPARWLIGYGECPYWIHRCRGRRKLSRQRSQCHRRKAGQFASAELLTPRVKLTAANSVQPANQRGRRSSRHALRQYPKLLFEAPARSPLRAVRT